MKNLLFLSLPLLLVACHKTATITVTNPLDFERKNEMAEFSLLPVREKLGLQANEQFVISDSNNHQIPYQILSGGETVVFQASVAAKSSAKYSVQAGIPEVLAPRTFARQVPERLDDFAWENDRVAFRMYGPALEADGQNPSNGVDMWLKRTGSLIIDKWYKNDLAGIASYHVDNGEGLDAFKVAHTLGAGGVAPFVDSVLWVGGAYSRCEVKEAGTLRTEFTLYYDSLKIGFGDMDIKPKCVLPATPHRTLQAALTVCLDAGNQLCRASVLYRGDNVDKMPVAAGLYLHQFGNINGLDVPSEKRAIYVSDNMMAIAADAVSNDNIPSGRAYMGVIAPAGAQIEENMGVACAAPSEDVHLLAVSAYQAGQPFVYYFGGGWNKSGFETDEAWFDYMSDAQNKIQNPLQVSVK